MPRGNNLEKNQFVILIPSHNEIKTLKKICLNIRKTGELHDINLFMYVIIHEMAHFACPEIGHGPLFQKIFKKFIEESINIGIYQYTDYNKYPQEYCGLILNSSIV